MQDNDYFIQLLSPHVKTPKQIQGYLKNVGLVKRNALRPESAIKKLVQYNRGLDGSHKFFVANPKTERAWIFKVEVNDAKDEIKINGALDVDPWLRQDPLSSMLEQLAPQPSKKTSKPPKNVPSKAHIQAPKITPSRKPGMDVYRADSTVISEDDVVIHGAVKQFIIVPSTKFDKSISDAEFKARIDDVSAFLADLFGGYTRITSAGGWVEDGDLIEEKNATIESYADKTKWTEKNQEKVREFVIAKCIEWEQFAVTYGIEDDIFIIDNPKIKENQGE